MVSIRVAGSADLEDVAALWATDGGPSRSSSGLTGAQQLFAHDPDAILVAKEGDTVVGTLVVGWDGWRCHLYRLAVAEQSRRRGIASSLIEAGLSRASALGVDRIDAMVNVENDSAIAFWKSEGFVRDDEDARWSLLVGQELAAGS